jgi:hypothetical protein
MSALGQKRTLKRSGIGAAANLKLAYQNGFHVGLSVNLR